MNSFSDHVNGILFRLISSESGGKRFYIFMKVVKVTGERKGENKILPLKLFFSLVDAQAGRRVKVVNYEDLHISRFCYYRVSNTIS